VIVKGWKRMLTEERVFIMIFETTPAAGGEIVRRKEGTRSIGKKTVLPFRGARRER